MPAEVDSIFNIKQVYTHLAIVKPWLAARGIYDPKAFGDALAPVSKYQTRDGRRLLYRVIDDAFDKAETPRLSARMNQYQEHERLLYEHVAHGGLEGTIPIFVEGMTVIAAGRPEKVGIDPFSNSNFFTRLLMEHAYHRYKPEFLEQFRFIFVQPVTYLVKFAQKQIPGMPGQHLEGIREVLADQLAATEWRGTLEKFDSSTPKIGNSRMMPDLFDIKRTKEDLASPQAVDFASSGASTLAEFLDFKNCEVYVNIQLEALKFAQMLEMLEPVAKRLREERSDEGLQIYMANTSWCADALTRAAKYSRKYVPLQIVGSKQGIHAYNKLPIHGICESKALGRLFGYIADVHLHSQNHADTVREKSVPKAEKSIKRKIQYDSVSPYEEFLLEQGIDAPTEQEKPEKWKETMHDIIPRLVSKNDLASIRNFAFANRVGFAAIQPRLVTLLTEERAMYLGFRKWDKRNALWLPELEGAQIVYPGELFGLGAKSQTRLFEESVPAQIPADVGGFEFAMPTSIGIDEQVIEKAEREGKFDFTGCSIDRLLSSMHQYSARSLINAELAISPGSVQAQYWHHHRPDHRSHNAVRSAAIHRVTLYNSPNFAHNQTLAIAQVPGLRSAPSDLYTRVPVIAPIVGKDGRQFLMRGDADFALLIKRGPAEYDILSGGTEISRSSQYPQHRRTIRGLFNGYAIGKGMESLGYKVGNIYVVQNTLAFYRSFYGELDEPLPHSQYREQKFSPVMKFDSANVAMPLIRQLVEETSREKRELASHDGAFVEEKKRQQSLGTCDRCFLGKKMLCGAMTRRAEQGKPVRELLNMQPLHELGEKYTPTSKTIMDRDPASDAEADAAQVETDEIEPDTDRNTDFSNRICDAEYGASQD